MRRQVGRDNNVVGRIMSSPCPTDRADDSNSLQHQSDLLEKVLRRKKDASWRVFELKLFLLAKGENDTGKKEVLVQKCVFDVSSVW